MAEWEVCQPTGSNAKPALQLCLYHWLHADLPLSDFPTALRIDPLASETGFLRPVGHLLSDLGPDSYRRDGKPLLARRGGRILRRPVCVPLQSSVFGVASIGGSLPLVYKAGEASADNWREQWGQCEGQGGRAWKETKLVSWA